MEKCTVELHVRRGGEASEVERRVRQLRALLVRTVTDVVNVQSRNEDGKEYVKTRCCSWGRREQRKDTMK